uniref:NADH dehydrogenase subunit 3 n=1 Tax=Aphelenchoides medicagus TaxID=2306573 RepID=UPI001F138F00|nr:NADH dehydrogenase subunit 3 [Aphelenchoides medicagus]UKS08876.1 NADH dehydrogenase subunit 3 [Aphelenchoides medicagus]
MHLLFFVFSFSMLLVFILYLLNFFISKKNFFLAKNSSFESGFLSVGKIQKSFSIHFFIIMLMFVVFDVEIVMILGFVISDMSFFFSFFLIFLFILLGLYMEWYYLKLVWSI